MTQAVQSLQKQEQQQPLEGPGKPTPVAKLLEEVRAINFDPRRDSVLATSAATSAVKLDLRKKDVPCGKDRRKFNAVDQIVEAFA